MNQEVVIYRKESREKISLTPKKKNQKLVLIGKFLIISSLGFLLLLISPYLYIEGRYRLIQLFRKEPEPTGFGKLVQFIDDNTGFARVIKETDLAMLQPTDPQFGIVIPKINVNSTIIPNVPVDDETLYKEALKQGVAQAMGSFFPDQSGTVYIFGHSTDYIWNIQRFNAIFYLLKELKEGDRIAVFYQENRYEYEVTDKKIVKPNELEVINNNFDKKQLILQTCWPPGTTWERLLVFAKPV